MQEIPKAHWFRDYKMYWGAFLLINMLQAALTTYLTPWPPVTTFFIFFGAYLALNISVSAILLVLTWPARRNLSFSRFIKLLIAFSAIYFLSQLIAFLVPYFQD
jgi:hypothetical protein